MNSISPRLHIVTGTARFRLLGAAAVCIVLAFAAPLTAPAASSVAPRIIEHGSRHSRLIALTFDACPTDLPDEYDEGVIRTLLQQNVPATLFLSGRWVERHPDRAKYLARQPQFEIAAHSYYHPHLLVKDDARVRRELARTQDIIKKVTGRTPRYFRPPFGEVDERIATIAEAVGLTTIQYDIASGDPDPHLTSARIVRCALKEARGGSILVFHMNRKGLHTAELLPAVIKGLRDRGFTLVTVGEMLSREPQTQHAVDTDPSVSLRSEPAGHRMQCREPESPTTAAPDQP